MKCSHRCHRTLIPAILLGVSTLGTATAGQATIRYEVSLAHPEQHLIYVTMDIPNVQGEVTVQMPAWNALYQIRDFSSHVQQVEAFAGSEKAPIEKMDKQTWRISTKGTITLRYATYWDEPGPFAAQLNLEHAFINPAMILLYIPERRAEDVEVTLSDLRDGWRAASSALVSSGVPGDGVHRSLLRAPNYDALADAPIEVANFEEFFLPGVSPAIRVVIHGDAWKKKQVEDDLRRICLYEVNLMDGAPYETFTFIFHIGKAAAGAAGGMEHANSTAIYIQSDSSLPGVSAHEFFHLWNVKRIRAASMEPVDYAKEQYSRSLWFSEGVTNTYASYALVRSGIWSKQQFYQDLGAQISDIELRPAEHWQSAEQSSLDAWLEKYSLYNQPQSSVSYYTKGQILGVLLDILIRDRTNNEKSLDDVLRAMNTDFAKQGKFYRDSLDIRLTAERIAGGSFEEFFQQYVAGTDALAYQRILALAGFEFRAVKHKRAALSFSAERDGSGSMLVSSVEQDGPAAKAGLQQADVILKWNGGDAPGRPDHWARGRHPGEMLRLRVRRVDRSAITPSDDREIGLDFPLAQVTEVYYEVAEDHHASEKARHICDGLLLGTTQAAASLAK